MTRPAKPEDTNLFAGVSRRLCEPSRNGARTTNKAAGEVTPPSNALTGSVSPRRLVCARVACLTILARTSRFAKDDAMLRSFLKPLFSWRALKPRGGPRQSRRRAAAVRPRPETLEERELLTWTPFTYSLPSGAAGALTMIH